LMPPIEIVIALEFRSSHYIWHKPNANAITMLKHTQIHSLMATTLMAHPTHPNT
jgi:hypothetical protein